MQQYFHNCSFFGQMWGKLEYIKELWKPLSICKTCCVCIITPTVLVALPDCASTARIFLAKWQYTTLWVLKTNILRGGSILIHKTFIVLAIFSHSVLFEGSCIFQLLTISQRIDLMNVCLLSNCSLVCIFCNIAAPRGSEGDEGLGMLGTVQTCSRGH